MLEFEPSEPPETDPLMGWIGSRDPYAHIRLRFPDRQSAIEFAEQQGRRYVVKDPPLRRIRPQSSADNFRYDLADAISRAQRRWDGEVSIRDRREPDPAGRTDRVHAIGAGLPDARRHAPDIDLDLRLIASALPSRARLLVLVSRLRWQARARSPGGVPGTKGACHVRGRDRCLEG